MTIRMREQIEQEISYFERSLKYHRMAIAQQSKIIEENNSVILRDEKRIEELKKELAEFDDLKPVPDKWGNPAEALIFVDRWYVISRMDSNIIWSGPLMPTKEEAIRVWNEMMTDQPRIVEEDDIKYAIFPIKVKIPEGAKAVAVDTNTAIFGYCPALEEANKFGHWNAKKKYERIHNIENSADMIIKIK